MLCWSRAILLFYEPHLGPPVWFGPDGINSPAQVEIIVDEEGVHYPRHGQGGGRGQQAHLLQPTSGRGTWGHEYVGKGDKEKLVSLPLDPTVLGLNLGPGPPHSVVRGTADRFANTVQIK